MAVPTCIPVVREAGYHTDLIGRYSGNRQFMAFVVATLPVPVPDDWESKKRWYAVLHTFAPDGLHLNTKAVFVGTTADGEAAVTTRAQSLLDSMLSDLGPVEYGDVRVCLFQVVVDGETFGLVDASEPEEGYESIHLLPNDLAFFEPWDGLYDT
jgi:hypothetical protein